MNDRISEYEEVHNAMAEEIIDEALYEVSRKYDANGEQPKTYHNSLHTREVMDRIDQMVDQADWVRIFQKLEATENLMGLELDTHEERIRIIRRTLKMAAAAHDVIQDYAPAQGRNELESAKWLKAQMKPHFSKSEIDWAKTAILATVTKIEGETPEKRHLKQKIPNNFDPVTRLLAQMLCDADIGNLGSDWTMYWRNVVALFKEVSPLGTPEQWKNFLNLQLALLENQVYQSDVGEKLFSKVNRQRNKIRVEALLRDEKKLEKSFEETKR